MKYRKSAHDVKRNRTVTNYAAFALRLCKPENNPFYSENWRILHPESEKQKLEYRSFARDVITVTLMQENNETDAMLVDVFLIEKFPFVSPNQYGY